jgi:HSP20 family molecular chaperone IbpA
MEKKRKIQFYWEEPGKEERQQPTRQITRPIIQRNSMGMPGIRLSFQMPKIQSVGVQIRKTEREIILMIPVPGFSQGDVKVNVNQNSVRIHAEKHVAQNNQEQGAFVSMESSSSVEKSFSIPEEADPRTAKISFSKGMVVVTMARTKKKKFGLF